MASALTLETMSPGLLQGVERAQREPEGRFHALAQWIDMPALERASRRQRADAAVGRDGVTKEQEGQALEGNLQALHARLKAQQYRHQPIRRVHIPKAQGTTRPSGMSAFEDKVVQDAVREGLEANAREVGEFLKSGLQQLARRYPNVVQTVRGLGLMLGVELASDIPGLPGDPSKTPAVRFTDLLHAAGVLVIPAGGQIIRLLPALNLRRSEAEEGLRILESVVAGLAAGKQAPAISS